jgi:hypothetical protein
MAGGSLQTGLSGMKSMQEKTGTIWNIQASEHMSRNISELSAYFIIRLKVSMAPAGYLFPWIRDGTAIPIA